MHQRPVNHETDFRSNFITQMYHTTMQYVPPQQIRIENVKNPDDDGTVGNLDSGKFVESQKLTNAMDSPNVRDNNANSYEASHTHTVKDDPMRKTVSDCNSGRLESSHEQMQELVRSRDSNKPGGTTPSANVRMNENDIRIVTLPPKVQD